MTRRTSLRAQAQEIFRERAQAQTPSVEKETPLPDPPPQGGRVRAVHGGREQTTASGADLTARVRALYEGSAVPVAAIARLVGVTERTVYKYAQKGGWRPRYAWIDRGGVARRRGRGARRFAPVKGAGGRFIARADKGKPFARGLKATDPAGAAQAGADCARAAAAAAWAQAEAEAVQWDDVRDGCWRTLNRVLGYLVEHRDARRKAQPTLAADDSDSYEQSLLGALHCTLDMIENARKQAERCRATAQAPDGAASAAGRARGGGSW